MEFLYLIFVLFCSALRVISVPLHDITYEELEDLNATCVDADNCKLDRPWYETSISTYSCHCNRFCTDLRTCCIDSPYRYIKPSIAAPSCRIPFGTSIPQYIVDKCPDETHHNVFKEECETDWKETDGILSRLPVTSVISNMTYKNIFCFRCNEAHDEYLYWNVKLSTNDEFDVKDNNEDVIPVYDSLNETWVAALSKDGSLIPVLLETRVPKSFYSMFSCYYTNLISSCSENWLDDEIRRKCSAYAAFVYFKENFSSYKNPHCALCNFQDLRDKQCPGRMGFGAGKMPFSFSLLLDINRSQGDKVGKVELCSDDSMWDPFFKKCRNLKCALPGHVVKNGKCTT